MRASAFVYPWDVVGDPEAPTRLAELGVEQVTLASAYHSTRALTPRHPRHRVVTARHSAVLYPPDPARWTGRALRPYTQDWAGGGTDPYGEAARALTAAGLEVHSWVVLAHNSRMGGEFPSVAVCNAYGDRYPWAPCIARAEVREYLVALAAEAAVREHTGGTELESCGWYGLAHLHAHDKTGGVELDGAARYLMSLCFCDVCRAGYAEADVAPEPLRSAVVRAVDAVCRGEAPAGSAARGESAVSAGGERRAEWRRVRELLGAERAEAVAGWRARAARRLRREAVAAVRHEAARAGAVRDAGNREADAGARTGVPGRAVGPGSRFRVLLHADPAPHRTGANAGVDPGEACADADGVVLPCTGDDAERAAVLGPFTAAVPAESAESAGDTGDTGGTGEFTVAANLTVVSGMGGSPRTLAADAAHARGLGASELRLYHAGLASDADLSAVREALARR